ncbi:MAG TPA: cyclic 2,3-diphosphoglycerate synthase [Burkholderiales bacterium]|nr:cyclic 2,3-diphosphoglycerate synthase [Burkholderiales bacterium]
MSRARIVILGAAGRDFHDFNVVYRGDPSVEVVAFTAAQIPGIEGRRYPPELAGPLYPQGIPIVPESELESLRADRAVLAYSDLSHEEVMHLASRALAAGADFELLGPRRTMIEAAVPVLAVCAVRTGAGKSPVSRWLARKLRAQGLRVAVVRHPMPYGDLARQAVQRFASLEDLERAGCTLEEREEYEPHLEAGAVVHAGVDYGKVIAAASREADVLLWDGGNNDFPFVRPDLLVVLADALRPDHGSRYHPGETCLRMADIVVVTKTDYAAPVDTRAAIALAHRLNPSAKVLTSTMPPRLERPIEPGTRVVVVEDGPTLTHGGMPYGAGYLAARAVGASIVDPRPWASAAFREIYAAYPHIGSVLPAVGYSPEEREALAETLNAAEAELVVAATPVDLSRVLRLSKPVLRARYEFEGDALWDAVAKEQTVMRRASRPRTVKRQTSGSE